MEIIGRLIQKLPLQSGIGRTGNSWQKQEFVIETDEQYPKKVCANLWGDKTDALSAINIGDVVKVSFHLESREFNGKWYTDVKAWKIEAATEAPTPASQQFETTQTTTPVPPMGSELPPVANDMDTFTDNGGDDDLPF